VGRPAPRSLGHPRAIARDNAARRRERPTRRFSPLGAVLRGFAVMLLAAALFVALAGTIYLLREVPSAGPAKSELMAQASARHAEWVPLDQVSTSMQQAIIATEDARFYEHRGLDVLGTMRAMLANLRAGTISQQLAKRYLERTDPTAERKLLVLAMTAKLELRYDKAEILEMYLNSIYFGPYAYGLGSAARVYFHKPATDLTLAESTLLAGLPQAPSVYDPLHDLRRVKTRQGVVIAAMVRTGYLTPGEAEAARTARTALDP
jgi:membrane peptidoglycan carboxypeptidase